MYIVLILISIAAIVTLSVSFVVGRRSLLATLAQNNHKIQTLIEFKSALVAFANSSGQNQNAFRDMVLQSTAVEKSLGWDNFVTGIVIGRYHMNGVALLPLALHEMMREYAQSSSSFCQGGDIAVSIQTVIFRSLGRISDRSKEVQTRAESPFACIAEGLANLAAIPISILYAFGLLTSESADTARSSTLFKLWSLTVAIATLCGPLIAYLADSEKVDASIRGLFL